MYCIYEFKVKQAQKEGATVADISAGLAYSVIKNALYKVIKITNPNDLAIKWLSKGELSIMMPSLRSFELISGCQAVRPDIAGIIGALRCRFIARKHCEGGERYHAYHRPDQ